MPLGSYKVLSPATVAEQAADRFLSVAQSSGAWDNLSPTWSFHTLCALT